MVLTWDDGDGFERSQDSKGPQGLEVAHFDKLSEQPAGGSVASAATQTHGTEQAQVVKESSEIPNSILHSCGRLKITGLLFLLFSVLLSRNIGL